jgi:hypothetical protein
MHRKSRFDITSEPVASDPVRHWVEFWVVGFATYSEHGDVSNLTRIGREDDSGRGCIHDGTRPLKSSQTWLVARRWESRPGRGKTGPVWTGSGGHLPKDRFKVQVTIYTAKLSPWPTKQTQPLVNVCKHVKQCSQYFSPLLNSSKPDSDFPYHQTDISLTVNTNNILFNSIITTSGSQVTFRGPDLDSAKAFSDDHISQSNWTWLKLSIGWKDGFMIWSHISLVGTKRLCFA